MKIGRLRWFLRITLLLLSAGIASCSSPPLEVVPTRVEQLHANISNVTLTSADVTSVHVVHVGFREDLMLFALATDALTILEGMHKHGLVPGTERLRFLAFSRLTDAYGNTALEPLIGVTFQRDDVLRINFESGAFNEFDLVDLIVDVWRRPDLQYSQSAIQGYCRKYLRNSPTFCKREHAPGL